jgi:hypothetical protein
MKLFVACGCKSRRITHDFAPENLKTVVWVETKNMIMGYLHSSISLSQQIKINSLNITLEKETTTVMEFATRSKT